MGSQPSAAAAGTIDVGGDLTVNRLGYGAMRITGDGIWGEPKDREQAKAALRRAVELGVNFIDTADSYGPDVSETLIAETLHPYPDDLVIASKGGRGTDTTGPYNQTVGGAIIHSVTGDRAETAGAMYTEVAAGAHIVKADEVTFEAETMLTLVMGASTVTMMPAMVAIAGVSVKNDGDVADSAALISNN